MAKLQSLNYKRNVNIFTDGNPTARFPHVLQTKGMGKRFAVPDLAGMTTAQANATLTSANLLKGVMTGTTGVVTVQSPLAGVLVFNGSYVDYTIA
jgi:beta-lactam-binding protein with PASTA domain